MNIADYIDGINDELSGAEKYIKKATSCKSRHPERASTFQKMSEAELGHAQNLVKMFEEDMKDVESDDEFVSEVHNSVISMYSEQAANIKRLTQVYAEK